MLLAEGINLYNIGRDFHWKWNCIVTLKKISAYVAQQLIPDPMWVGSDITKWKVMRNGSGISQRAAAARSQRLWRWLVIILEPLICERKLTSWDGGRVGP